jgi:hypothetical protein
MVDLQVKGSIGRIETLVEAVASTTPIITKAVGELGAWERPFVTEDAPQPESNNANIAVLKYLGEANINALSLSKLH